MLYKEAFELASKYADELEMDDPRFDRCVHIEFDNRDTFNMQGSFYIWIGDAYMAVFSIHMDDPIVFHMDDMRDFKQYEQFVEVENLEDVVVKLIVCKTCNDTHKMSWHNDIGDVRTVMCTRCPVPCQNCRKGAYCANTPCSCACHKKAY